MPRFCLDRRGWSQLELLARSFQFFCLLFVSSFRQHSWYLLHRASTRKPPATSQRLSIILQNLNPIAHLVPFSNGVESSVPSYATRLTRPPHIPPPVFVGAIRSDCPGWTNLARGRLGRSLQPTVCLSPFFYHILIKYIRPDLCTEFCDIICPCSATVGNFHLPHAPLITSAATALNCCRRVVRKRLGIKTSHHLTYFMPDGLRGRSVL